MRFPLLLTGALATAVSASAGVLIVEKTQAVGGGEASTSKIYVDAKRMRVDSGGGKQAHVFIYRADQETIYVIDPEKKTYHQMSKQQLEQMMGQVGDQMAQMKKMMEEQMKDMPPQQRQMMERMMKGKMGAASMGDAAKTVYRKVASGERVGRWTCDKYEGHRGSEKVQEVWTTDWKDFGLSADDFQVMRDLAGFFKSLTSRMGVDVMQVGAESAATEEEYSGVPVQRISYRNGKPHEKHEVTEVSRQNFDSSLFEVPQGYRKTEMR